MTYPRGISRVLAPTNKGSPALFPHSCGVKLRVLNKFHARFTQLGPSQCVCNPAYKNNCSPASEKTPGHRFFHNTAGCGFQNTTGSLSFVYLKRTTFLSQRPRPRALGFYKKEPPVATLEKGTPPWESFPPGQTLCVHVPRTNRASPSFYTGRNTKRGYPTLWVKITTI